MLPLPLTAGDRIYTAKLVEATATAGAFVHFVGLANPEYPVEEFTPLGQHVRWDILKERPRGLATALFSEQPIVGARHGTAGFKHHIVKLLRSERWDAVVLDQYGMSWALPYIPKNALVSPLIIHVAHDFETHVTRDLALASTGNVFRKWLLRRNAAKAAAAEQRLAAASDLVITLTTNDSEEFRKIEMHNEHLVLPPGFDGLRRSSRIITKQIPRRLAIVGSYHWAAKQHNLASFLAVADPIFASAGLDLSIVGDGPQSFRDRWQNRLRATRFVPFVDDLGGFLDQCRLGLMVEAVGGGFKLKILDYVFARTPVAGLREGLRGQSQELLQHVLAAATPAELAIAVVDVVDDLTLLNRMQEAAFQAVDGQYDWDVNGQALTGWIAAAAKASASAHPGSMGS